MRPSTRCCTSAWSGAERDARGRLGEEERQQHEQARRPGPSVTMSVIAIVPRPISSPSPCGLHRTRAHQPARADDERLVQQHDAAHERRARKPVTVEYRVERLLRARRSSRRDVAWRRRSRCGRASARLRGAPGRRSQCAPWPSAPRGLGRRRDGDEARSEPRRPLEALLEALHLAGSVDDRLLAGEERVAVRADVDVQRRAASSRPRTPCGTSRRRPWPAGTWDEFLASCRPLRRSAAAGATASTRTRFLSRRSCSKRTLPSTVAKTV